MSKPIKVEIWDGKSPDEKEIETSTERTIELPEGASALILIPMENNEKAIFLSIAADKNKGSRSAAIIYGIAKELQDFEHMDYFYSAGLSYLRTKKLDDYHNQGLH